MKNRTLGSLNKRFDNDEKIILRDFLAMERTTLANERTVFSYLRTSLYLSLAGIAFLRMENFSDLSWLSYVLFGTSAFLLVYGVTRYRIMLSKLRPYYESLSSTTAAAKKDRKQE